MRLLLAFFVLGLILTGCGDSPASPTSVPLLAATRVPAPAPSAPPSAAGSADTSPARATLPPPLVPAFPTSTVAFSGRGPTVGAFPFALYGGTYHVRWATQPTGPGWTSPTWRLDVSIHDPAGPRNAHLLVSVNVPAGEAQNGTTVVRDIPAGMYVLDATAAATCLWNVSIAP